MSGQAPFWGEFRPAERMNTPQNAIVSGQAPFWGEFRPAECMNTPQNAIGAAW